MTPDELRALAEALYFQGRYGHETERQAATRRVEERKRAADYLRACADAQPVRAVPIGHALSAVRHVGSANYPDRERAAIERLYSAEFDAYTHPAPAAPQAEPKRQAILGAVARAWCHPKNASKEMDVDLADAIVDEVLAINQAEPKEK